MQYTQEQYEKAEQTSIVDLLGKMGYSLQRVGNGRLRVKKMDSIEISVERNCFYRHSHQEGGGAVQLFMMLTGKNTQEAVQELCGEDLGFITIRQEKKVDDKIEKKAFVLPTRAPHHRHVFAYLQKERKILPAIISEMMHQKKLYETVFENRGREYYNCVFVGENAQGEAVHASTRFARSAQGKSWRIESGSDSLHPFSMTGNNDRLCIYESPIDALSGASLEALAQRDWQADHRLALHGLSQRPIETYLQEHSEIKHLVFCLDNDVESVLKGEENHGQVATKQMREHFGEKGYSSEYLLTDYKDLNQALVQYTLAKEQKAYEEEEEWAR